MQNILNDYKSIKLHRYVSGRVHRTQLGVTVTLEPARGEAFEWHRVLGLPVGLSLRCAFYLSVS